MTFNRLLHDCYRDLRWMTLRRGPSEHISPTPESFILQAAGQAAIHMPLEGRLYGESFAYQTVRWDEKRAYTLADAYLVGPDGLVYSNKKKLFPFSRRAIDAAKLRFPLSLLGKPIETGFSFLGRSMHNRAHFFLENLPRLFQYMRRGTTLEEPLLLPSAARWLSEYTELAAPAGYPRVVAQSGTHRVGHLIYAQHLCDDLSSGDRKTIGDPAILRDFFRTVQRRARTAELPMENALTAIWVSRADAPHRRLINEDALIGVWKKWIGPIRKVTLSGCSLAHQLFLLARAPVLIFPQGQGAHLASFFRDRLVVLLEQGDENLDFGWDRIFALSTRLAGNDVVRLFNRQPFSGTNGDWTFAPHHFVSDMRRLPLPFRRQPSVKRPNLAVAV